MGALCLSFPPVFFFLCYLFFAWLGFSVPWFVLFIYMIYGRFVVHVCWFLSGLAAFVGCVWCLVGCFLFAFGAVHLGLVFRRRFLPYGLLLGFLPLRLFCFFCGSLVCPGLIFVVVG